MSRIALFSSCLPGWDSERVIDAALELGLDAVEWGLGPDEALTATGDGGELARRCQRAGLTVAGLSVQDLAVTLATPRRAFPCLALAAELGAPHVRFFAPPLGAGRLAAQQRRVRAGLDALVGRAGRRGPAVLVETSPDTLAASPGLAAALVAHHPPARAGVLYDPGNMLIEGYVGAPLALAELGRHVRHVHVKNIAWSRRDGTWSWRRAPLDGGMVDWGSTLRALARSGYRGRVAIDHLPGRATLALLRREAGRLRELLEAAG
jgi:sugar phosphate isomerase/epimerase